MNERLLAFVFFFIALALSACSSFATIQKTATPKGSVLVGSEWSLTGLRGEKPLPGSDITLVFQEKEVGGSSGCNTFGGSYLMDSAGSLVFGDLMMTERACLDQAMMTQEADYLSALSETAGYKTQANQLEITNTSGETILIFTHK